MGPLAYVTDINGVGDRYVGASRVESSWGMGSCEVAGTVNVVVVTVAM